MHSQTKNGRRVGVVSMRVTNVKVTHLACASFSINRPPNLEKRMTLHVLKHPAADQAKCPQLAIIKVFLFDNNRYKDRLYPLN